MRHCRIIVALVWLLVMLAPMPAWARQEAASSPLTRRGFPEVKILASDEGIELLTIVPAGRILVTLENRSQYGIDTAFILLPDGVTGDDVDATFQSAATVPPSWFYETVIAGGAFAPAGAIGRAVIDVTPGAWVISQTDPTVPILSTTVLVKEQATTGEIGEPEADLTIRMGEYGFSFPNEIQAGPRIWKVVNAGTKPHAIAFAAYPEEVTREQVIAALERPADATPTPTEVDLDRFGDGTFVTVQSAGVTSWVEVELASGVYVALCPVPDPDATIHALRGQISVVQANWFSLDELT